MGYVIDGKDCMIGEWILLVFSFIFVALRVYTRLFRLRKSLDLSDWILLISALDAIGLIACDTATYKMGVMDEWAASVKLSKISFASNYFYDTGMGFPKLSILAFYYLHFPQLSVGMKRAFWVVTVFVCLCYLTILFDDTFYCGVPVSVQWSQAEGACSVFYANPPFYLNFALNLTCYVFVYALPVAMIFQGTLETSIGLAVTLVLAFLTIVSTIVRFATLHLSVGGDNLVYPLSMLEMALAITVISLPGLKPLLERPAQRELTPDTTEEITEKA